MTNGTLSDYINEGVSLSFVNLSKVVGLNQKQTQYLRSVANTSSVLAIQKR